MRSSTRASRGGAAAAAAAATPPAPAAAESAVDATMESETKKEPSSNSGSDASDQDDDDQEEQRTPANTTPSIMFSASIPVPPSSITQQHMQAGLGGLSSVVTPPTGIARFSTVGPHPGSSMSSGMMPFSRQLSRQPSMPGSSPNGPGLFATSDWRANVAVEERIAIRRKLREAYFKNCSTYEQLLDTVTAVDEEMLFACTHNRLDYLKSGVDFDVRVQIKRQQLKGSATASAAGITAAAAAAASPAKKRAADDITDSSVSLLESGISNSGDLLPVGGVPSLPPMAQLTSAPKSPAKDTASSLISLGAQLPAAKKQRT